MPDFPSAGAPAVHNFINELRAAFERAGPPTYARLETLSNRLHNPDPAAGPRVLVLPHSTTHDILTRRREKLPSWPWVASFISVLCAAAVENGLGPDVVGTMAGWHTRYREARAAVQQASSPEPPLAAPTSPSAAGAQADHISHDNDDPLSASGIASYGESLPAIDGDGPPAVEQHPGAVDDTTAPPGRHRYGGGTRHGAPAGSLTGSTWDGDDSGLGDPGEPGDAGDRGEDAPSTVPPPERTIMWRRYVETYGRTGMRLLRHAEADKGKEVGVPAYRLATLLACEQRRLEAGYWMERAAQSGNDEARRLAADWMPAADGGPPAYWRPTDAAYEIGLHYEVAGQPFSAVVFFDRAACNGHSDAAYRAGLHRMQIGRYWDAMLWFNRAARSGHQPAQRELEGLLPHFSHIPPVEMLGYGAAVGSNGRSDGLPYPHQAGW
jgi:hypothetical protein